eukprot:SAG22_NODE_16060_length_333_cov_1.769231_1_plen_77_part_10
MGLSDLCIPSQNFPRFGSWTTQANLTADLEDVEDELEAAMTAKRELEEQVGELEAELDETVGEVEALLEYKQQQEQT